MIVYCDTISVRSALAALRLRFSSGSSKVWKIRLFDPLNAGAPRRWAELLRMVGFQIEELEFFAGQIEGPNGQAIPLAARGQAFELCYHVAESLLTSTPAIATLNDSEGRNTIALHLAKRIWLPLERLVMACMLADVFARRSDDSIGGVWMHSEWPFEEGELRTLLKRDDVRVWQSRRQNVWSVGTKLFAQLFHRARKRSGDVSPPASAKSGAGSVQKEGNLFLLQEGDASMDRSYRTQPHWLWPGDPPAFDTFLMATDGGDRPIDPELAAQRVRRPVMSRRALWKRRGESRRWREALGCLWGSLVASRASQRRALRAVAALQWDAYRLFVLGKEYAIGAWMTCENYFREADAMVIAAADLGGSTVSYQYANVAISSPALMTTADTMVTFGPTFNPLWTRSAPRRIGPVRFESDGYPFSSSFGLLKSRARRHRAALADRGAQFVICYFDESVVDTKYSLINERGHRAEIMALLRLLVADCELGLVIKTQFQRNSPSVLYADTLELKAAAATGRYLELMHGSHRNTVFPAEAAMASDIVIGHMVGGTAPLEAALAGTRAVMLNPFGVAGRHADLYQRASILFPSLPAALDAIRAFRAGERHAQDLGDWTRILPTFDPYRDGGGARRMRARFDAVLLDPTSSVAAASARDR